MKRWLIHPLMAIFFLLNMSFFGWVVWVTYFRSIAQASQMARAYEEVEAEIHSDRDLREHFHNIDSTIYIEKQNPSVCIKCHGTYPHSKAKDVRSFLNAHAYFISCEVCHIRDEKGLGFTYKWVKSGTVDEEVRGLSGKPGNYGAVIVPFIKEGGLLKRVGKSMSDPDVVNFLKVRDSITADEAAEVKLRMHGGISQKPIFCDDCHKENGHLDFRKLLYSEERSNVLSSMEVAGLINKYKEFYIPTMFDPKAIMMERQTSEPAPKQRGN